MTTWIISPLTDCFSCHQGTASLDLPGWLTTQCNVQPARFQQASGSKFLVRFFQQGVGSRVFQHGYHPAPVCDCGSSRCRDSFSQTWRLLRRRGQTRSDYLSLQFRGFPARLQAKTFHVLSLPGLFYIGPRRIKVHLRAVVCLLVCAPEHICALVCAPKL